MNSTESKLKQFRYENDTWKRSLEFIMQENIHLKNRLADVLRTELADEDLLNAAEQYQNHFVMEDETIHLLRKDIADMDRLLIREVYEDGKLISDVVKKQRKMSAEMKNAVTEFNKLKFDFNNYLAEAL